MDSRKLNDDMLRLRREFKSFSSSKFPSCPYCGRSFVNAVDSITGLVSCYLWMPDDDCRVSCFAGRNFVLSMG